MPLLLPPRLLPSHLRSTSRNPRPEKKDFVKRILNKIDLRAVNVEPPVADEVLLVEEGSVGAEEAVPWEKELIMR